MFFPMQPSVVIISEVVGELKCSFCGWVYNYLRCQISQTCNWIGQGSNGMEEFIGFSTISTTYVHCHYPLDRNYDGIQKQGASGMCTVFYAFYINLLSLLNEILKLLLGGPT